MSHDPKMGPVCCRKCGHPWCRCEEDMNRVLIIWDNIGINIQAYCEAVDGELFRRLKICHGHYVNLDYEDPEIIECLEWLQHWLKDKEQIYNDNDGDIRSIGLSGEATTVIITGFLP